MKNLMKLLLHLLWFAFLTLMTQVGGIIWLLCLPLFFWINKKQSVRWKRFLLKTTSFSIIYLLIWWTVIPPLAIRQCGRVPLPVWSNPNLKPHHVFYYCLLNHHYVRPEMKTAAENVARQITEKYPGAAVYYLDANFPFMDGYPLEPHFSHRDGKKLDVALYWIEVKTGKHLEGTPTSLGYGVCAAPEKGEVDYEEKCGNWYPSLDKRIAERFYLKENYRLNEERTRELIRLFAEEKAVTKILLEPHLKTRLKLQQYDNIRFQGCHAARHDDHIHVQ